MTRTSFFGFITTKLWELMHISASEYTVSKGRGGLRDVL